MNTIVVTVENDDQARLAVNAACNSANIPEDHVHVITEPGVSAASLHSHETPVSVTSDMHNAQIRGLAIGGLAGFAIGVTVFLFTPVSVLMVLTMTILGIGIGGLGATLFGASETNPAIDDAITDAKQKHQPAVVVEVAANRQQALVEMLHRLLPSAVIREAPISGGVHAI